jgi:hypothetical protein
MFRTKDLPLSRMKTSASRQKNNTNILRRPT